MSQITSQDFLAVVPDSTASLCSGFTKAILRLPQLLWQWVVQVTRPDGSINGAAKVGDLIFSAAPLIQDSTRLLCNGQEVPQSQYPALYTAIGSIYGTATSAANFKLPDFSCRFPCGVGNTTFTATDTQGNTVPTSASVNLGQVGGEQAHRLIQPELPNCMFQTVDAQNPTVPYTFQPYTGGASEDQAFSYGGAGARRNLGVSSGGNDMPHNNVPPFVGCYVYLQAV